VKPKAATTAGITTVWTKDLWRREKGNEELIKGGKIADHTTHGLVLLAVIGWHFSP
jgi:hypothetical protein